MVFNTTLFPKKFAYISRFSKVIFVINTNNPFHDDAKKNTLRTDQFIVIIDVFYHQSFFWRFWWFIWKTVAILRWNDVGVTLKNMVDKLAQNFNHIVWLNKYFQIKPLKTWVWRIRFRVLYRRVDLLLQVEAQYHDRPQVLAVLGSFQPTLLFQ